MWGSAHTVRKDHKALIKKMKKDKKKSKKKDHYASSSLSDSDSPWRCGSYDLSSCDENVSKK